MKEEGGEIGGGVGEEEAGEMVDEAMGNSFEWMGKIFLYTYETFAGKIFSGK